MKTELTVLQRNIRYLLNKSGLTQEQFANKLCVKRSLVGAWCEGRSEPNRDAQRGICEDYHLKLEDLLYEDFATGERFDPIIELSTNDSLQHKAVDFYGAFLNQPENVRQGICNILQWTQEV